MAKQNRHSVHISLRKDDRYEDELAQAMKFLPHGWGKIVFIKLLRSILPVEGGVDAKRRVLEMLCTGPVNFSPAENMVLPAAPNRPFALQQTVPSSKAPAAAAEHVSHETQYAHHGGAMDGLVT